MPKHKMTQKMRKAHHKRAREVVELEDRLASAIAERDRAVVEAVAAVRSEYEDKLAELRADQAFRDGLVASANEERQALADALRNLREEVALLNAAHVAAKSMLGEVQPTLDKLDVDWTAMLALLDGVKDRLRRREVQAANAILNRRAVARALFIPTPPKTP